MTPTDQAIIKALLDKPFMTRDEIAEAAEANSNTVKTRLTELVSKGVISWHIATRSKPNKGGGFLRRYWVVSDTMPASKSFPSIERQILAILESGASYSVKELASMIKHKAEAPSIPGIRRCLTLLELRGVVERGDKQSKSIKWRKANVKPAQNVQHQGCHSI